MIYEINENLYELEYNIKVVENIENTVKVSIIDLCRAVPSIGVLKNVIAFGLKTENGRVSHKRGLEIAEEIIRKYNYLPMFHNFVEALYEDCGFLFVETL